MTPVQHTSARVFPGRADPKSRATIRANWGRLLAAAQLVGDRAAKGQFPDRDQAPEFAHLVVRYASQAFPLSHESATRAAKGFREFAQGFVFTALPELKTEMGRAMAAAARCCAAMLELDVQAQAAAMRRRTGERDEED